MRFQNFLKVVKLKKNHLKKLCIQAYYAYKVLYCFCGTVWYSFVAYTRLES